MEPRKSSPDKISAVRAKIFLTLAVTNLLLSGSQAATEGPVGIATTYNVTDGEAVDGDLLCLGTEAGELKRCQKSYDEKMFGVLAESPQVVLRNNPSEKPVVREGKALVNVTNLTGPIKIGDFVTSSTVLGKGQKATEYSGWVIGRAVGELKDESGQIEVALSIGPAIIISKGNILDELGVLLVKNVQKPEGAALFVRYVTAGLVALFVTFFAFNNFGGNVTKGIEAVGRNPLARNQIQFFVVLNVILMIVVTLGGMLLSLALIRV